MVPLIIDVPQTLTPHTHFGGVYRNRPVHTVNRKLKTGARQKFKEKLDKNV